MEDIIFEQGDSISSLKTTSQDKWKAIKPAFIQLYLVENKTLDEVKQELAVNHNFHATVKAYKYHIKLWDISKNYTATQKEQLARYQELMLQSGNTNIDISVNGRPVKWDRVRRHQRLKAATIASNAGKQTIWRHGDASLFVLQPRNHEELFIGAAKHYLDFQPLGSQASWRFGLGFAVSTIEFKISQLDIAQHTVLWEAVQYLCQQLKDDLTHADDVNSHQLYFDLLEMYELPHSHPPSPLVQHLQKYIVDLGKQWLRKDHPLQYFLRQFEHFEPSRSNILTLNGLGGKPLSLLFPDLSEISSRPRTSSTGDRAWDRPEAEQYPHTTTLLGELSLKQSTTKRTVQKEQVLTGSCTLSPVKKISKFDINDQSYSYVVEWTLATRSRNLPMINCGSITESKQQHATSTEVGGGRTIP